jgi:hypothetical protein
MTVRSMLLTLGAFVGLGAAIWLDSKFVHPPEEQPNVYISGGQVLLAFMFTLVMGVAIGRASKGGD